MDTNKKVGEFVSENIASAHVFKKYGIDFCCGGGISLSKACEKYDVAEDQIVKELEEVSLNQSRRLDYQSWDAAFLIDHIINIHHKYVEEAIPITLQYANKVQQVHGHAYPELKQVYLLFQALSVELLSHLKKEEQVLFPALKELQKWSETDNQIEFPFGSVNNPISVMENEHENAGDIMKKIRSLTNDYQTPDGACNTFKALYHKLEEFEDDLFLHIHLENNILFHKGKALMPKNELQN